ncbi:MAG: hypothetical protein EOP67_39960, partial [Sphingomonas sp.]
MALHDPVDPLAHHLRRFSAQQAVVEIERLGQRADWPETTPIGEDGLGLDSIEQLGALGALAEAFDLDDSLLGREPPQVVGEWI